MAWPVDPSDGETATVGNVLYVYSSELGVWNKAGASLPQFIENGSMVTFLGNVYIPGTSTMLGAIGVNNATPATSTTTGSVTLAGGIGIAGNAFVGTNISVAGTSTLTGNVSARHMHPQATGTYDLGTAGLRWRNIYTSDLNLNNGVGDWTIVEGEDDLFLYNNKRNKVYKFALIEVDPSKAPPKID
jgi:hypothetical protein